jgi:poly(A) polymerase
MPTTLVPSREFACQVVKTLVNAGFDAYFAGGCVRDQLMGRDPKDYDVATSATPEQVRDVFGHRRTLPIGQSFGVITVLAPKPCAPIEVATFRRESGYSDGRHPDEVAFTNAREDALRRDFTINGMFFDPLEEVVLDFVGGQDDLQNRVIRAIGDPVERIAEDKLRMLRAVRFAATFGFELEAECLQTIQRFASQIQVVSAERITAELHRMLSHSRRANAADLLLESGLLAEVLPESPLLQAGDNRPDVVRRAIRHLTREASFPQAMVLLLHDRPDRTSRAQLLQLAGRLKLANTDRDEIVSLSSAIPTVLEASKTNWPQTQRALAKNDTGALLDVAEALQVGSGAADDGLAFCREMVAQPREVWNPEPLLDGNQLQKIGIEPGPQMGKLLNALRDSQLAGEVHTPREALEWVERNQQK